LIHGLKDLDEVFGNRIFHQGGVTGAKPLSQTSGNVGWEGWLVREFAAGNRRLSDVTKLPLINFGHRHQHAGSSEQDQQVSDEYSRKPEDNLPVDDRRRPATNL
jgi:hypothetical protein